MHCYIKIAFIAKFTRCIDALLLVSIRVAEAGGSHGSVRLFIALIVQELIGSCWRGFSGSGGLQCGSGGSAGCEQLIWREVQ